MYLQGELKLRFNCVEYWQADPRMGLYTLPISGQFLRTVDLDIWTARLKAMLPADAQLMLYDGLPIIQRSQSDTILLHIGSMAWHCVGEGQMLPMMSPFFVGDAVENPAYNLRTFEAPKGVEVRLAVNKQTHALIVPKEEETDEMCVVVARPK